MRNLSVLTCASAGVLAFGTILGGQDPQPFRTAVDLIPIDIQVVDKTGRPVTGLAPHQFEVTLDGRRRRVVSASLVDYRAQPSSAAPASGESAGGAVSIAATLDAEALPGRIFIIAVDANSLDIGARLVLEGAADFIRQLSSDDEVGLFAFPGGPIVDVTTNHDGVIRALEKVVPRLDVPPPGEFRLSPGELVELAKFRPRDIIDLGDGDPVLELAQQFCPPPLLQEPEYVDPYQQCLRRLENEVRGQVMMYESAAQVSAGNLRDLMAGLGRSPRRKTLVLVSGGLLSSNQNGGRPDNRRMGLDIGRSAAAANVSVYALFIDAGRNRAMSSQSQRAPAWFNPGLESNLRSQWLDDFSGSAGGSMLRVALGDGNAAFGQVLRETSAFYLLGVEPGQEDRDGRAHELRVKVRGVSVSVRGRSWVVVPKPGAPTADLVGRRPPTAAARRPAAAPEVSVTSRLLPPSPEIAALADAFVRNDRAALARALASREATSLLQAFRSNASPFPAAPRRSAIFALDLAAEGLRSSWPPTREEALRLLAEYMVRVRQAAADRTFECAWLWTASVVLEGQFEPEISTVLVDRAAERCPDDANIRLARAVVRDQELMAITGRATPGRRPTEIPAPEARVLDLYRRAAERGETREEATIRSAYLHLRGGRAAEGLSLLERVPVTSGDRQLVYVHLLARGQLLAALDRSEEATESFLAAAAEFPRSPSAMVGLMTMAVRRGDHAAGALLAERVMAAERTPLDPWWLFALGDYRAFEGIRAQLRSFGE